MEPTGYARFLIRTSGNPDTVLQEARRRIAAIDPMVPLTEAEVGRDVIARQTAQHRLVAVLLGGLALSGCVLALTGVYGTVGLTVARRRREFGIRLALGETRARVGRGVVGAGLRPVLSGGVLGVGLAWIALPSIEMLLFRVPSRDPVSALVGLGVVIAAAAAAAGIPARRASLVDPADTLRRA
jgi:ABC-type antimicrobial peptide transport system permease subunit